MAVDSRLLGDWLGLVGFLGWAAKAWAAPCHAPTHPHPHTCASLRIRPTDAASEGKRSRHGHMRCLSTRPPTATRLSALAPPASLRWASLHARLACRLPLGCPPLRTRVQHPRGDPSAGARARACACMVDGQRCGRRRDASRCVSALRARFPFRWGGKEIQQRPSLELATSCGGRTRAGWALISIDTRLSACGCCCFVHPVPSVYAVHSLLRPAPPRPIPLPPP
jgi:hypothetical protein